MSGPNADQRRRLREVSGAAASIGRLETQIAAQRETLAERMATARDAGVTDVHIAIAAGVTKGRVGQILGPRHR